MMSKMTAGQAAAPDPLHRMSQLPFRPASAFAHDDAAGTAQAPAAAARIVIVEDDYLIAYELESALVEAGYQIVGVAASADEAAEIAAAEQPALAVMDIRLSGERDGIDAALELFEKHRIRCVFASAHQTAEAHRRAEPACPLAWISKPYTMESLVQAIQWALSELRK
jgi:DNA-binding NarL/FixJ family response regulator